MSQARADASGRMVASSAALVVSKVAQIAVLMGSLAILARELGPAEFGAAALASIVPDIVQTFHQFGMSPGLMRERNPSRRLIKLCLWNAAWRNLACSAVIVLAGAAFAVIYGHASLFWYSLMLAPALFYRGVNGVHRGILEREMRFGLIATTQFVALVVGVVVAIATAQFVHSALPLVLQTVADTLTHSTMLVIFAAPLIRRLPEADDDDPRAIAEITRIGRDLTFSKVLRQTVNRLDQILVGYFAGPAALGLYAAARRWSFFLPQEVHLTMLNVSVAALTPALDDAPRFRRMARNTQALSLFMALPATAFLFLEAEHVIQIAFGDQWSGVVPLFRILLVAAVFRMPVLISNQVYYAEGRTREQLVWTAIEGAAYALAVASCAAWGERAITIGYTVAAALMIGVGLYFAALNSRARVGDFLIPWLWVTAMSLVAMAGAGAMTDRWLHFESIWLDTVVSGLIFSAIGLPMAAAYYYATRAREKNPRITNQAA